MTEEKAKILIIEENDIFCDILADKLGAAGYRPFFLTSEATLDEVKLGEPKLAIINIVTPKEKGLQLIEKMYADSELSSIPVVVVAKTEGSVLIDHAKKYGVEYAIDKALFDVKEMLENISFLLNGKGKGADGHKKERSKKGVEKIILQDPDKGVVLLVEDDVFMRELFADNLRTAGFKVYDVENAVIAEKILEKDTPDVILLDLILPTKSGFQFLSEIKHKEKLKNIPVIVVSNLGSKGDVDHSLDLGAADFLVKANVTMDEIVIKVEEHIKKSRKKPHLPESVMNGD